MRWMWIDRILELKPRERLVAIKALSLGEEYLWDHFPKNGQRGALPIMPASLIVEGMAQSAGILVGQAEGYKEKVILAKVGVAEFEREAMGGMTLRYTVTLRQFDRQGASTDGVVELLDHTKGLGWERAGRIDLMFSHIDRNMAGIEFPEENFVFGDSFRTLLRISGLSAD